jgi:signal transduction histidine kinase/DNA-binding response OmpR family regulator
MQLKNVFSFIIILASYLSLQGQDVYKLSIKYPVHNLIDQLLIIEESKEINTALEVLKKPKEEFKKRDQFPRFLDPEKKYWGRLLIQTHDNLNNWTLNFEDKWIGTPAWTKSNGKVDVYAYVADSLIFHKITGVQYPKSERELSPHWILNQVPLNQIPVDTIVSLVIKIESSEFGYPPYFNLSARSPEHAFYHQIFQYNNSFNIFMFGITFIIFLYHLLQYLYLREKVILWFTMWIFFVMVTQAMSIGLIIGLFAKYRFIFWLLFANGVFYSFWFFGRSFINSKKNYPKLDRLIIGMALFIIIEIALTAIYVLFFEGKIYYGIVGIHYEILLFYSICGLILSVYLSLKKDVFARYFGVGSIIGSSFLIIGALWSLGLLKPAFNLDPYGTGMFLQIVIYSFGIAYRKQVLDKKLQKEILEAQETHAEMKRVKDLEEIKSRFFANISHEFKTPLTLIKGPLKRASKNINEANDSIILNKKSFDVINNNADRLQKLVEQLLELSKIESGAINLDLKQGDLIKFLRSIVESFEGMAERKNISFRCSFPEEYDRAVYDEDKLEKIVTNLLSNAFKFTPLNGHVTVLINHNMRFLTIEIADSGKGIDESEIKQIFDRFYRGESNEEKGTGIGLSLTKEMVDLHGGKINVSSTKNIGTTFKIALPMTIKDLPSINNHLYSKNNINQPSISDTALPVEDVEEIPMKEEILDTPVVLIVEDNKDLVDFIEEILRSQYVILTAENGLIGERIALEKIPDLIISDVMMPIKNGYEMCKTLKTDEKTNHIPIIMLTAKGDHEHKMEGLLQGANAYLTKPFDDEELIVTIKNLIKSRDNIWKHFKSMDMFLVNELDINTLEDKFLQDIFRIIKENMDNEDLRVDDIASQVGFSRSQLHRKLKALLDKSANQLVVEIRMNEAYRLLQNKVDTVSQVAYSVGYSNLSYFTKSFKQKFGVLPSMVEEKQTNPPNH